MDNDLRLFLMMLRGNKMKKLILIIFLTLCSTFAEANQSVKLMTEEFAPYQYYDGEGDEKVLTGISVQIVKEIQKRVGNNDEMKVLPWSRSLKLLEKKKNSALFSTARTPSREDKYKWVGPLAKLEMIFFRKVGSGVSFSSMEEAKKISKVGVTKNVATHEILMNQGFKNLDVMQSGSDDKNLKRLIKGRIDVWPTGYYSGIYNAKKIGVIDQIEVVPGVSILSGSLYIAFNKETDTRIINVWQTALDDMRREGFVDQIMKKYER